MTFRQILAALWRRLWVVVVVLLVAGLAAGLYTARQAPEYASTTTLRLSSAAASGQLQELFGSVEIDLEAAAVVSPAVLDDAATRLGEPSAALEDAVSYAILEGTRADQIRVTAIGGTAEQSRLRADAVAEAFVAYVAAQVETGTQSLQEQYDAAVARAQELQDVARDDPDDLIAAADLTRELDNMNALAAQISRIGGAAAPATVTTPASEGERQGTPPALIIAAALSAGLLAGIGLALIAEQFDARIRRHQDLAALSGAPLLAELPYDRAVAKSQESLAAAARRNSPLNEGLRSLRTSMQVLLPREGPTIVVLTSVEPGDGKSFVSSRLAVTWARAGKSTVLVGGDLRRPALPDHFGDDADGPGLAELLRDAARGTRPSARRIDALLRDSGVPGLRLLPAGTADTDTSDLLALPELGTVLGHLGETADIVLVDAPPSLALTDAALLASHAAGAVVVTAMGRTTRERLTSVVDELSLNGAKVLGVVANRSRRRLPASYAAYYQRDTRSDPAGAEPAGADAR
ncbi:polysaccharide biosynthesis tyrosine autokinase [Microbacterium marinilacus]|uniref:Polysaccharide chain length determinant N-terminal domain-containing protein n=1 Tax=Microbacterium marinilacus TaxID=415209 RepID=A0ABP7BLU8_9MICO|nr:CpsD/CapB family tyrosine-protein kinase [Microbacterium marinilacus]MBY0690067.1 CpsD/CapB family tyrosine-protein kinase [Microbacterium marinilacus]